MTLRQLLDNGRSRLEPLYGSGEAEWMMRIIMEYLKGWKQADLLIRADEEVSDFISGKVDAIIGRLLQHEPLQYILGETYWHGMTLKVTPDVLIPRPETSELVDIIAGENSASDLRVLDVCTGSGCIAVALATTLPFAVVTGTDISDKALDVARENASLRKLKVNFIKSDALRPLPFDDNSLDIIVSNPPYIVESEKKDMDANVLDHEPSLALFVPDSDPLKFYTPIAHEGLRAAAPGGRVYFEINPLFASQTADMMRSEGWDDVQILPDMHGKQRFAKAVKPS